MADRTYATSGNPDDYTKLPFTRSIAFMPLESGGSRIEVDLGLPAPNPIPKHFAYYCPLRVTNFPPLADFGDDEVAALSGALTMIKGLLPASYENRLLKQDQESLPRGAASRLSLKEAKDVCIIAERLLHKVGEPQSQILVRIARGGAEEVTLPSNCVTAYQIGDSAWVDVEGKNPIHSILSALRSVAVNLDRDLCWLSTPEDAFRVPSM